MQNNYSEIDLILHYYDELKPEESLSLINSLKDDFALMEKFHSTKKCLDLLSEFQENPSPTSVDLILEYSKSRSSLKTTSHI